MTPFSLLTKASSRYYFHTPWLTALALFSIALGVAVVTAVDLANQGAMDSLHKTTSALDGGATHQLIGPPGGMPEQHYPTLTQTPAVDHAIPVVEGMAYSPLFPQHPFILRGVDLLSEATLRPHLGETLHPDRLLTLLTEPNTAYLLADTAQQLGLQVGDRFPLVANGQAHQVTLAALLAPKNPLIREGMASFLIVDIATAQELLGMVGRLSRIDLILTAPDLPTPPPGTRLLKAENQQESLIAMTRSFRLNLTALSLLALLVGMFIIFNTITFSVVRRRRLIGLLRAQGVTRRALFILLLKEALLLAIPGTAIGLLLGIVLGHGMVELVTRTINDLYFHLPSTPLHPDPTSLLKGAALGIGATLVATLPPAWEATTISPATALTRSSQESHLRPQKGNRTLWIGFTLLALGGGLLLLPDQSLAYGFAALALLIVGSAFLAPRGTLLLMSLLKRPMSHFFGLSGRVAVGGVVRNLSRTGVAVAALSVAVATALGMGLMIHSFRSTVEVWLEQTLSSDIYISLSGTLSTSGNPMLKPQTIETLKTIPGVHQVGFGRKMVLETELGRLKLLILEISKARFNHYLFQSGDPETLWPLFQNGQAILISESLAFHKGLKVGDTINLPTPGGSRPFTLGGILYDYRANAGLIIMNRALFQHHWHDNGVANMGITVSEDYPVDQVVEALKQAVATQSQGENLVIRSNQKLRQASLDIFDRTFAITRLLRLLGVVVAFFGVLTALMAIQMERFREMAVFRALGLTRKELGRVVVLETGLLGLAAGLFAIPLGWLQGQLLIHVINYRSFGWTLLVEPDPFLLSQSLLIAIPTALIAGLFPAYQMANTSPAEALREA
ncbi:MAG: FtsX-like permease family protein [Magnetococcales bacterium]|nr:FtsX-like permease family protein [Magnetococcales bacterium]